MGRLLGVVGLLAVGPSVACLCAGCSGTGAPASDRSVVGLQALANDHLSAFVLVRSWFSILHVKKPGAGIERAREVCAVSVEELPPLPDDPPGTTRWRGTASDCLSWEAVLCPDGAGEQTYRRDGQESHMTWGAPRMEGPWQVYDINQTMWDGAGLVYESGYNLESTNSDQYWKGRATLADGREMDFELNRNDDRDQLALSLPDGSALQVEAPLTAAPGAPFWPRFAEGAEGTFRGPTGLEQGFRLTGSGSERWDRWVLRAPDGTVGSFTLAGDFSGSGLLRRGGEVVGTLSWDAPGDGVLTPVGASAVEATPSAAARDFQIDRWIRNIAALGPMPVY